MEQTGRGRTSFAAYGESNGVERKEVGWQLIPTTSLWRDFLASFQPETYFTIHHACHMCCHVLWRGEGTRVLIRAHPSPFCSTCQGCGPPPVAAAALIAVCVFLC